MKNIDRSSIFDGLSQAMDALQPEQIQPIMDRVLVRDVAEVEKVGMLFIPQTAKEQGIGKNGLYRRGVVVSVGRGDKFKELGFGEDGKLRRQRVECGCGDGMELRKTCSDVCPASGVLHCHACSKCGGSKLGRLPMPVRVGDTVIYDRRKDLEVTIRGTRHSLINVEQSIFATMEGSVVRPLQDKILVQYAEKETETAGGIVIPEAAQEKPRLGTVVAAGPGFMDIKGKCIPLDVKVGDTVLFGNYAGTDIEVDGETFLLMSESAVMGVVNGATLGPGRMV